MSADQRDGTAATPARKRRRTARALATALLGAVSVALLVWVAPPGAVIDQITNMNPLWLVVAVALELGSCLSYVVLFRRFFPEPPRQVSRKVAWTAMGAGAVLPGGNISSAAATGWLLRNHGVETRPLVERCAALLCLLTGFGFAINGVAGVLLLVGVPGGTHDLRHTVIPILVSLSVLSGAALVVAVNRRLGKRAPLVLRGVAAGLEGAWRAVGRRWHWRLLGGVGFLCLDMGALWAACQATGHPVGPLAVVIAYCIGYLATMVPMPAGLGVLDSGLAGALVLYGFAPAASVGAVLVYHAISIWIPGGGALLAWVPTRRAHRRRAAVPVPAVGALQLAGAVDADGPI